MSEERQLQNQVRAYRVARGWSQEELAARAAISRAGVSAIEMGRLVPSATAVLALAAALGCRVEELFSLVNEGQSTGQWAWEPAVQPCRYWHATVAGRKLLYPVEPACVPLAHAGIFREGRFESRNQVPASEVLVVASCDPALGLLANEYHRRSGLHILALQRPSREALSLVAQGLVHVAGVHLERRGQTGSNAAAARAILGNPFCLLRTAYWQEGLAVAAGRHVRSVQTAIDGRLRWVGREPGSAAGELQQELLPGRVPKHVARGHRGVAEAVRGGWADVGICVRLVSEEAGLDFLSVREETYDLCFSAEFSGDPRVQALVETVQSPAYRALVRDLPGYDVSETGELERIDCTASR
jgi:molybdate-binding protein/transcriptional regulator with XRE-family HTH domain